MPDVTREMVFWYNKLEIVNDICLTRQPDDLRVAA